MLTVEVVQKFDWNQVKESDRVFVQERQEQISAFLRQSIYRAIEVGLRLAEIKQCLGHGLYRDWIEAEFPWSKSAAHQFECVANRFGHLVTEDVQLLDKLEKFNLDAIYELAAPGTPETVVSQAIEMARQDKTINLKQVKALKAGKELKTLEAGQTLTVKDTESPYAGQAVTVQSIDKRNGIAKCTTDQGEAELLLDELLPSPHPNPQAPAETRQQPPNQLAIMATELEVERERVRILEDMLRRLCAAARVRQLTASILVEAEELLQ